MVKIARRSCGSAPPHLGAVASRIRSSPLESLDRTEPGWFLNIPPMSKASALFLQPLAYRGKRGTQPGKLSTLHLGRVLIYSLVAKSHAFQLAVSPACTPSAGCSGLTTNLGGAGAALFRCCSWLVFSGADASLWLGQH